MGATVNVNGLNRNMRHQRMKGLLLSVLGCLLALVEDSHMGLLLVQMEDSNNRCGVWENP